MTPKEKAEELVMRFYDSLDEYGFKNVRDMHSAINCALIAVDELIKDTEDAIDYCRYWHNVKQEIEKL